MTENATVRWNAAQARQWARDAGFTEAAALALPYANEAENAARFQQWIAAGHAGQMHYMEQKSEAGAWLRESVALPFPWARSMVVCLASYNSALPRSTDAAAPGSGWIARYAWSSRMDSQRGRVPSDYHKVLRKRLDRVADALHAAFPACETRVFVDTGPVLERAAAVAASLGWTGKNTCLIHPQLGSFVFLGVLLTSQELEEFSPATLVPDRCGSCRRCIDACPTGALVEERMLDARRCISYLTIEHKGPMDAALQPLVGRQIFGCDICQDVCPWNRKALIHADAELAPRAELVNPSLAELAAMDEAEFERRFNGSPVRRASWDGFRRNLAVAIANSGNGSPAQDPNARTEAAEEGHRSKKN